MSYACPHVVVRSLTLRGKITYPQTSQHRATECPVVVVHQRVAVSKAGEPALARLAERQVVTKALGPV